MMELSGIQEKDEIRRTLAEQVAVYESKHGPVQTLPIRIGNAPVETFSINTPGKPKSMPSSSQALRAKDHSRVTLRTAKKLEKLAKVRELAAQGLTIAQMAERSGFSAKYCQRLILENGIARGRKTNMEA